MANQVLTNNEKIAELQRLLTKHSINPRELSRVTGVSETYIANTLNYYNSLTDDKYNQYMKGIEHILDPRKNPLVFNTKDRKTSKAPKKLHRDPKRINVPVYIIHHLHNYHNVFVNQKTKIDDLIYTLKNEHGLECIYVFDNENGYIVELISQKNVIDDDAWKFIKSIKAMNLKSDEEIINYLKESSSPEELKGFLKGMVVKKISDDQENELWKYVNCFIQASQ